MQVNPISNRTFKACYKAPYSDNGYNKLFGALKLEDALTGICRHSKPNSCTKDISFFAHSFPYEHLYSEELTSVLIDNKRITEDEAEELGIKLNIFQKLNIFNFSLLPPTILNNRLENLRNKGLSVDSIGAEQSIYVTTDDDTKIVEKFMVPKIDAHLKKYFGKRKQIYPLEFLEAMSKFYPGPKISDMKPKEKLILKIIDRHNMKVSHNLKESIKERRNQLITGNLSKEETAKITDEITSLESQLSKLPEPRYVKNARILLADYNQEKERFNNLFFKDREVIPVKSVEELLTKL